MTRGDEHTPGGARSFRGRLYHMLTSAGFVVDFLGSQSEPPAVGGDPNHDAWGGAWIGPGGSDLNIYDRMPRVLAPTVKPDIIVLALGWNSAVYEKALAADKYEALVSKVAELKPEAQLVLGTLSPYRGETEAQTASYERGYREINQRARDLAGRSASDHLHLTELALGSFVSSDYIDPVHWNQSGADKAAKIVFDTIVNSVLPTLP
jgi:lysophospholipase L1-like esterase